MRSMTLHLGVIRDKEAIYSALQQSQSLNRQLAICFSSEGKLLVKICTVVRVTSNMPGSSITVRSGPNVDDQTTIPLDDVQSIYPICDFV